MDDPACTFIFPLATSVDYDRPVRNQYRFDFYQSETLDVVWRYRYERMQQTGLVRPKLPPVAPTDAGEENEALSVERTEFQVDDY